MDLFRRRKKNNCDQCGEKFESYDELIKHARHIHHHPIVKCQYCGKEFIYEKDRQTASCKRGTSKGIRLPNSQR